MAFMGVKSRGVREESCVVKKGTRRQWKLSKVILLCSDLTKPGPEMTTFMTLSEVRFEVRDPFLTERHVKV